MANTNYNVNIPSSDATVNPVNLPYVAPAVAVGTARHLDNVTNAHKETQSRKRMKKTDPNSITNDEVANSLVREAAVLAEHVAGKYGAGVATAAQVDALTAMVRSDRARRLNANIPLQHPLTQLRKEVAGVGNPLPNRAPAAGVVAAPVGTLYPVAPGAGGFAPSNLDDLVNMTLDQISALSQWANDDFGIVAGDNVGQQRNKLRKHYQD